MLRTLGMKSSKRRYRLCPNVLVKRQQQLNLWRSVLDKNIKICYGWEWSSCSMWSSSKYYLSSWITSLVQLFISGLGASCCPWVGSHTALVHHYWCGSLIRRSQKISAAGVKGDFSSSHPRNMGCIFVGSWETRDRIINLELLLPRK